MLANTQNRFKYLNQTWLLFPHQKKGPLGVLFHLLKLNARTLVNCQNLDFVQNIWHNRLRPFGDQHTKIYSNEYMLPKKGKCFQTGNKMCFFGQRIFNKNI